MIVAAGRSTSLSGLVGITIAGGLSSGGSAALNHYLERNKDVLMSRTDQRPVATRQIAPKNALVFGIVAIASGLILADVLFNPLTALMISLGSLSYIFLYTLYLKPRTYWNIVIGGIAGVFPALAGWAAAVDRIGWPALFIGLLVFLWTPPHFWGLSLKFKEDYARSGYPMLSVVKNQREVITWISAVHDPTSGFFCTSSCYSCFRNFRRILLWHSRGHGPRFCLGGLSHVEKSYSQKWFQRFSYFAALPFPAFCRYDYQRDRLRKNHSSYRNIIL